MQVHGLILRRSQTSSFAALPLQVGGGLCEGTTG